MARLLVFGSVFFLIIGACNSSKRSGSTIRVVPDDTAVDSADYFNKDYTVTHIANEKRIEGEWDVNLMYKSPDSLPEKLSEVTLVFTSSSISGKAPCNRISGNYTIADFKITFSNIAATKMACDRLEKEAMYLELLSGSVDNFTFAENRLVLRNKNGGVVFECTKSR
jgi:heat shock protein HslJ